MTHPQPLATDDPLSPLSPDLTVPALPACAPAVVRIVLRLTSDVEPGQTREFNLRDGLGARPLRGGRNAVSDLVLADPRVSEAHFDLEPVDGRLLLRDLDSEHGVWSGGARIREAWLDRSAAFQVGDTTIEVLDVVVEEVPLALTDHFGEVFGRSAGMRSLFRQLTAITERGDQLGVLIHGAPGSGKELAARTLHAASLRNDRPLVVHDSTQIPLHLAGSHLFGHARGAFPGAVDDRRGCFEAADGGTLLLKGVDALPLPLQTQLYRTLQEGGVTRLGERTPRRVDVRLICCTHRDLRRLAAEGSFRPELYFRIAGASLTMPSLAQRGDDIEFLAEYFLRRLAAVERRPRHLSDDARLALRSQPWPDNVRGLRRILEYGYFAGDDESISRADLGLGRNVDSTLTRKIATIEALFGASHVEAVAGFERLYFRHLLGTHPSKAKATRTSGMTHEGFRLALRRLKLSTPAPQRQDDAEITPASPAP